jgi:hypothetical protein
MLSAENPAAGKAIDGLHQAAEWSLLALVLAHIAAASSTRSTIAIASCAVCYRAKVGVERVTLGWQSGR